MSGDETILLLINGLWAVVAWSRWIVAAMRLSSLSKPHRLRTPLLLTWAGCLVLLTYVLRHYADEEVRSNLGYQALFVSVWGVVLAGVTWSGSLAAWDPLDNGVMQRNRAVVCAVCGLWIGVTLLVAGANIGSGPTIYTTLGPLLLALAAAALLWISLATVTGLGASVSIERDVPSASRAAGFFTASGLVLGRAVAGHWESWDATRRDFLWQAWPLLALWAVAAVVERFTRPSLNRMLPNWLAGIPGVVYVVMALAWVVHLGWW